MLGTPSRVAIFDRDGTINEDRHYLARPEEVVLLPGAAEGMRRLAQGGYRLIILTNQSGLARGYFNEAALDAVHARLRSLLAAEGVFIAGIYTCPHHPDAGCVCRKPRPGLVEQAVRELDFLPEESLVFGDKASDIALGHAVGATTILVSTGYGAAARAAGTRADIYAASIAEAVSLLFDADGRR